LDLDVHSMKNWYWYNIEVSGDSPCPVKTQIYQISYIIHSDPCILLFLWINLFMFLADLMELTEKMIFILSTSVFVHSNSLFLNTFLPETKIWTQIKTHDLPPSPRDRHAAGKLTS
jgi:hypothetical protein